MVTPLANYGDSIEWIHEIRAGMLRPLDPCHDKMNNVRCHCTGESVSAVACRCDVITYESPMGSMGLPALFSPQEVASVHHEKMHESIVLWTNEGCGSYLCFAVGGSACERN